jgi:hypothetical protein
MARRRLTVKSIRYSYTEPANQRRHYVNGDDVDVLLARLPVELWERLRTVHFNDRGRGGRMAGYVNRGRREIALCAMPRRVSLTRYLVRQSPRVFGAERVYLWSPWAVRRFMLYEVFLHELGHLQLVDPNAKRIQRRFASETKAQTFAEYWRKKLWSQPFDHPDPIHNPPTERDWERLDQWLGFVERLNRICGRPDNRKSRNSAECPHK